MRRSLAGLIAVILVLLAPVTAYADTSIACMYMLLRVYHAEMETCRVALPTAQEAGYRRMRAGMEKFIRANAKNDPAKIIAGVDDNIKRALAGLKSCQSDDFMLARQALDRLLAPDNEKLVNSSLTLARDPMVGDCSS
jgi:hypothetical protein